MELPDEAHETVLDGLNRRLDALFKSRAIWKENQFSLYSDPEEIEKRLDRVEEDIVNTIHTRNYVRAHPPTTS